jgi:hypothetical protein
MSDDEPLIHNPPNAGAIDELYAWVSITDTGEGILGAMIEGSGYPLVTGSRQVATTIFRNLATKVGEAAGCDVRLLRFARDWSFSDVER